MLRGYLNAQNLGDSIRLYFIQRGSSDENRNVPVKIYRRDASEIPFCNDLAGMQFGPWFEYAANQSMHDPRVSMIFEGVLPLEYSYNEYLDTEVAVGKTYLYWVEADSFGEHTVLGPRAVKVRSRELWWPYNKCVAAIHQLQSEYPELITVKKYGETSMHRDILAMQIGNPDRTLALAGVIHASEPGPELLDRTIRYMLAWRPELFRSIGLSVMPGINYDVREESVNGVPEYLRLNRNGVDLNRNFGHNWSNQYVYGMSNDFLGSNTYHGPFPNSETETQAAIAFMRETNPLAVFVYDGPSFVTEDKLLVAGIDTHPELYAYGNELATIYTDTFRAEHTGCGTYTAPPMRYPFQSKTFTHTGNPTGTMDGWALFNLGVPGVSLQNAGSKEGWAALNDDGDLELLDKWSKRHAHALFAVMDRLNR